MGCQIQRGGIIRLTSDTAQGECCEGGLFSTIFGNLYCWTGDTTFLNAPGQNQRKWDTGMMDERNGICFASTNPER